MSSEKRAKTRKGQWRTMARWLETGRENYSRWSTQDSEGEFFKRVYARAADELGKDIEWIGKLVKESQYVPAPSWWAHWIGAQALADLIQWGGPDESDELLVDALVDARIWDLASSAIALRDMD